MKKILILIFCLLKISNLFADHILGCDVSYKSLGNDTFLITARAYKDCNLSNVKVSDYSDLYILYNVLSIGCTAYSTSMFSDSTLTTLREITPKCSSIQGRCQSGSSSYPFGIIEYTFYCKIYLGNANTNCCQFRIVTDFGNRLSSTNTLQNPLYQYVNVYLNRCINTSNSSPVYKEVPKFVLYTNTLSSINNIATDDEGDSLVTIFSIPDANAFTCQYYTPYSSTNPFNSITGHTINPITGEYTFKPWIVQTGLVAYRTQEYRKINGVVTKLGEIYREHVVYILSYINGNSSPQISSTSTNYTLCPGQQTCFDITTSDGNSTDSVFVSWNQTISAASFTKSTSKLQSATFCWTPATADARTKPYYFTVSAKDNHCPTTLTNTKTYTLLVAPSAPTDSQSYTNLGCGKVLGKSLIDSAVLYYNPQITWTIPANNGVTYNTANFTHTFPTIGTYIIKQTIAYNSSCSNTFYDTIVVTSTPLIASLISDTTVCQRSMVSFTPNILLGVPPYSYKYNNVNIGPTLNYVASKDSTFILEITDSNNCVFRDTFNVIIKPIISINAGVDFSICANASAIALQGTPTGGSWTGQGVSGNNFSPSGLTPNIYSIVYSMSNANGCNSYDTVEITVKGYPITYAGNDTLLCLFGTTFNLTGIPSGGNWSILNYPSFLNGSQFLTSNAGTGKYTLIYTVQLNGCIGRDTMQITITQKPIAEAGNDTSICKSSSVLSLQGQPSGGVWSGTNVVGNSFNPQSISAGIYTLYYNVTVAGSACSSFDSMHVTVVSLPQVNAGNDTTVCKRSNVFNLKGIPTGGVWSGLGVSGSNVLLSSLAVGQHSYIYSVLQNGCIAYDTLNLNIADDPLPKFSANPLSGNVPLNVIFTNASSNAISYNWFFGDPASGTGNSSTLPNPTHTYITKGKYSVTLQLMSIDGCDKDTTYMNYIDAQATGIGGVQLTYQPITIIPNPASTFITITGYQIGESGKYYLLNTLGQEIGSGELLKEQTLINIAKYPKGLYMVRVGSEIGRFVIE